jgi:hypothetical protein
VCQRSARMEVVDGLTGLNRNRVIEFAALHRIPFMYEGDFIIRVSVSANI